MLDRLLEPSQLKRVLNFLENEGYLFNIIGKDEIMSEFGIRRLPGRPGSNDKDNSSVGGRPSAYEWHPERLGALGHQPVHDRSPG